MNQWCGTQGVTGQKMTQRPHPMPPREDGVETGIEWPLSFAMAIKSSTLCINAAEVVGVVEGFAHGLRHAKVPSGGSRVVFRCDNEDSCSAANTWRAKMRTMGLILRQLKETCDEGSVRIWLQHIPGADNQKADDISRDVGSARKRASRWEKPPQGWANKYAPVLGSKEEDLESLEVEGGVVDVEEAEDFMVGSTRIENIILCITRQ